MLDVEVEDEWKRRDKADLYSSQLANIVYALLRRVDGLLAKSDMPVLGPDAFFHKDPTEALAAVDEMSIQERKERASRQMRGFVAAVTGDPSVLDETMTAPARRPAPGAPGKFLVG